MMNIRTRDEAHAYIRRIKILIAQCTEAGLTGAIHDNERSIRMVKRLWSIK